MVGAVQQVVSLGGQAGVLLAQVGHLGIEVSDQGKDDCGVHAGTVETVPSLASTSRQREPSARFP